MNANDATRNPYYSYYKGPPPLTVGWTGCYLGGHVGVTIANYDVTDSPFAVPITAPPGLPPGVDLPSSVPISLGSVHLSSGSALVGGQAGCNLDLGSKWLVGVEADAAWTRITNSKSISGPTTTVFGTPNSICDTSTPPVCTTPGAIITSEGNPSARTDFIATATARLGYEIGYYNQGLVYGKGRRGLGGRSECPRRQ
jgi:outer membrane immunogenic protein